jgi:hypothetical protein
MTRPNRIGTPFVILGLDPRGAKVRHFNRSFSQCYPSFSGCYPSSFGSTGGSAEPHRAVTDGPVKPNHDGEGAFHKVGDATFAPMGLDYSRISRKRPIRRSLQAGAGRAHNDPRVEPEDDEGPWNVLATTVERLAR